MVARVGSRSDTAGGRPRSGFLFALPPRARERLVREAIRIDVPAASQLYGSDDSPAAQLYLALDDLSVQAFGSVRQRVVRQLLDLALRDRGLMPVVHATHAELADAVASVRVVVTRILHQFRDDGLIQLSREGIVLCDPSALALEVADRA